MVIFGEKLLVLLPENLILAVENFTVEASRVLINQINQTPDLCDFQEFEALRRNFLPTRHKKLMDTLELGVVLHEFDLVDLKELCFLLLCRNLKKATSNHLR